MKQPANAKTSFSSSDKTKIILVSISLAILLFTLGILLGLVIRQARQQRASGEIPGLPPTSMSLPTSMAPPTSIAATASVPTADCGSPTLVLGSTTFQIQTIEPAPDGSLTVPSDASGIAYWLEGTEANYVFVISPTPENLAVMQTVTVGSTAKASWSDCTSWTYGLSAPQVGSFNVSALPDQTVDGITVFFETDSSGSGFVFRGDLPEEQTSAIDISPPSVENTLPPVVENPPTPIIVDTLPPSGGNIPPPPLGSEVLAEITLLEGISSDGASIRVGVSIYNYGGSAFTLSVSDVALTPEGGAPLALISSEPALPRWVGPGATETVYFTFPRPSSQIATLRIFTIEFDTEGY